MTERLDLVVVTILIFLSLTAWFVFGPKPLVGGVLFTLAPVVYLSWRYSLPWKKILLGSAILGFALGAGFDLIQSANSAWTVDSLIIPWKAFGVLPIDNVIAYFLMTVLVTAFYERFFGTERSPNPPVRFYLESAILVCAVILIFAAYGYAPDLLKTPYSYLTWGLVPVVVTVIGIYRRPHLVDRCLRVSFYFFFVWFGAEVAALRTGGWSFDGQYIGWVSIFGVRFPIEELFFWMFWYAPFLVVLYEHLMRPKESQTMNLMPQSLTRTS